MEEWLEQKIIECSCYRKYMAELHKFASSVLAGGGQAMDPNYVISKAQECFDEIGQIKDQRK